MNEPSWADLEKPQAPQPANPRLAELCAMVFSTGAGKELIELLRATHIDSLASPLADERALRVRAAKQHLVRELELARDRGLKAK